MNGLNTFSYLNITPLSPYDGLIGMDWLDAHNVFLDFYNKTLTYFDEKEEQKMMNNIPKPISIRDIPSL